MNCRMVDQEVNCLKRSRKRKKKAKRNYLAEKAECLIKGYLLRVLSILLHGNNNNKETKMKTKITREKKKGTTVDKFLLESRYL